MTNNNQTAQVTDEELDQMIWKLERDGMTPKMLSLMRELREVRRARVEPVAYLFPGSNKESAQVGFPYELDDEQKDNCLPLYTAPTAPVVPDTLPCPVFLEPGLKFGKGVRTQCMLDALNRRAEYYAELDAMTPEQRAEHDAGIAEFKAMLSPGNSEQLEHVSNRDELPLDYLQGHKDGLAWAAQLAEANHPQTGDWLYDDPVALAAAIRKGPDMPEFKSVSVDGDDNFYSWFGRFWYENYQQNNYTASAKQMLGAMAEFAYRAGRESAARAGNSPATPDGWIPVSERMPPNKPGSYEYIVFDSLNNKAHHDYWNVPDGSCDDFSPFWNHYGKYVTHWQPLPAAPKEVKGE